MFKYVFRSQKQKMPVIKTVNKWIENAYRRAQWYAS